MTNQEAREELADLADSLNLIPSTRKGQAMQMALDALKEQKTGKWVGIEYDGYADGNPVYDVWECSCCHEEYEGDFDSLPNYCPECGAKMEV